MWSYTVADPGEGPGGPPLFLVQTEAEKNFGGDPPLSKGLDDRPHPPCLKVWMRHCYTHQSQSAKHLLLNGGG